MSDDKQFDTVNQALNEIHDDDDLGVAEEDRDPEERIAKDVVESLTESGEGEGETVNDPDEVEGEGDDEADGFAGAAAEGDDDSSATDRAGQTPEDDVFDAITPEQLAEIKSNPTLNRLRKDLLKGYQTKAEEINQIRGVAEAFHRDPQGMAHALALEAGLQVVVPGQETQPAATPAQPAQPDASDDAAKARLVELYGEDIGNEMYGVMQSMVDARTSAAVQPLQEHVQAQVYEAGKSQLRSAEEQWKARHADVLTPEIEKAVTDLGNSGKIVPNLDPRTGTAMSPGEYLETLLEVVLAKQGGGVTVDSSKKLAARIAKNRKDQEPRNVAPPSRGGKSGIDPSMGISAALDEAAREIGDIE